MSFAFISGGGESGALIREINWAKNPLGAIETWPQSLRTTLSIILNSKFPMFLFWGPELICFYNDAYRPSLGNDGKHPGAMGAKAEEIWAEIWDAIKPLIDQVLAGGEATWSENQLIPIYRNGKLEDVYWTFSYSPAFDESEKPAGVFITCTESTDTIHTLSALKSSKEELEFAINAAELGTWDLNPITNKFTANNRLKRWFGLSPGEEVDLKLALDVIIEKDRTRVNHSILNALNFSSGGNYTVQYTIVNSKNGRERVVKAKGKALYDENNVAYRLNGTLQDVTDEVAAQNAYKESEENFKKLILQAPVGMIILKGDDFMVELVNDTYLNLAGKSREGFVGKSIWDALPESKSLGFESILKNVMSTGIAYHGNEQTVNHMVNGHLATAYVNFVYEPLKDFDGSINRIMVVAVEVTDIIESKRKIQDAEERARLAVMAGGLGTWDLDLNTNRMRTSSRFDEIFGLNIKSERIDYAERIHPEDRKIRLNAHSRALIIGQIFYEVRVIWNDNTTHWIKVEGKVYFDGDNKASRMLGTVADITQQRKAKEDILKVNQRLEIALEAGSLGSYELDLSTQKIKFTDQLYKIYGFNSDYKFNYTDLVDAIESGYKEKVMLAMQDAIQNGSIYQEEYQIRWPDNSLHWIRESGKARYDQDGIAVAFISVSFDITETKQFQQQKDDFIGIASHELKTPVTSIKAYAQVLEKMLIKKGDVMEAGLMKKMDLQLNRLTSLIGDLLDVTKVNSGRLQYNHTHFDFNEMVLGVMEELQRTTDTHVLRAELEPVGLVYTDMERISQVLINLISNAIKYSPLANEVIISMSLRQENIIVCVKDFGIGIVADKLTKVFEQFYRVSGNMQHTYPGLGLGLYISSEIIKREGGKIWVDSIAGQGSTFCFSIPVRKLVS